MRKSRKLQLKAMNVALENYSEQSAKDAGLSKLERGRVLNVVKYQEPYTNIEVYKTNQIYKTMKTAGEKTQKNIQERLKEEE